MMTANFESILLISSDSDEARGGVTLADLNGNTSFGDYQKNLSPKDGDELLKVLIDTPQKDGKVKMS